MRLDGGPGVSTTADKLREARKLIEDPERWCRNHFAVDAEGRMVKAREDRACRWCAEGALFRVVGAAGQGMTELRRAARELGKDYRMRNADPAALNDHLGHSAVLRMYDRAIELAEAES